MSENYLVLDGKRIDLTEEQIKTLGLDKKDCFSKDKNAYYIKPDGEVWNISKVENADSAWVDTLYATANLCTDKELLEQRALHETLNRLLWRFSMQNDGDKIDWDDHQSYKYRLSYDHKIEKIDIDGNSFCRIESVVYFYSRRIANRAIQEVVEPFMKAHPEFKW